MTSTGHPEPNRLARIEQALMRDVQAATRPIEQAWAAYVWEPLPNPTQAAIWSRLLCFTSYLLGTAGHDTNPIIQAMAAQSLLRWLQRLGLDAGQAIVWLLDHRDMPYILLDSLARAAIADVTAQMTDAAMERSYHMMSPAERVACVNRLRKGFQTTDGCLNGLPSWAFADKLPAIHRLCVQELQHRAVFDAVEGEDSSKQPSRSIDQSIHQQAEACPVHGSVPWEA